MSTYKNMSPKYLGSIDAALGSGAAGVFTNSDILWSDLEQVCIFILLLYLACIHSSH